VTLKDPEAYRAYQARWAKEDHAKRRLRVIEHYGHRCMCCGEGALAFLTMDHVNEGGNEHRRSMTKSGKIAGSTVFYKWIEKNNYPPEFQVLCHNCNFAKSHGGCPHNE